MKTLLILAGGFGTRLRSVVSDVPKPLAPVNGKPFLTYLIKSFVSQGAKDLVLLVHFEYQKVQLTIEEMRSEGLLEGANIRVLVEDKPLGTGGSILNAINTLKLEDSFLVANADSWLGEGLQTMHKSKPPSLASIKTKNCSRYGSLLLDGTRVLSFEEKNSVNKEGWINAGLYHLSPDIFLDYVQGSKFALENKIFPNLANHGKLCVEKINTEFIDIGVPDDYFRFCKWIEGGKSFDL